MNTKLRIEAKNNSENGFFKLINNGKCKKVPKLS